MSDNEDFTQDSVNADLLRIAGVLIGIAAGVCVALAWMVAA